MFSKKKKDIYPKNKMILQIFKKLNFYMHATELKGHLLFIVFQCVHSAYFSSDSTKGP